MTPLEIKIELLKRGTSMRSIARRCEVSTNAVWLVVNGKMVSLRLMQAIAEAIGQPTDTVFPWYFGKKAAALARQNTCN